MAHTKRIEQVLASPPRHWVGDGFHVASVISPQAVGDRASPFVLMDYGGPDEFAPGTQPRGVDSHPHRGFETVTVVYAGELEHRDSAGNRGSIGPGDVQWMTAGRGVLHEEKHSERFTRQGGVMEMAQLWVNLPARHKMTAPRYQTLLAADIATVPLPGGAGHVRVIAGDFGDVRGAAQTFTPVVVWDGALRAGGTATLPVPDGFGAVLFVRRGILQVHEGGVESRPVREHETALLETSGAGIAVSAEGDAEFLVLAGLPLGEPMATYGPFVMNTAEEIQQAVADFRAGRFGQL
jgi:quercetin 2,3-dioxygenase